MRVVRILGAGPSGLAAALTLAAAGRRVTVYERRHDCGTRFDGDLQGLENFSDAEDVLDELRRLGIAPDFHRAPFSRGVQTNGLREDEFAFRRPVFYLVRRGGTHDAIDQSLKRQALAAGVRFRFGVTLPPAQADVVATGPRGRRPFAVCGGIVFRTDAPDMAAVLLDDRAGLKGYSYLLVSEGHGCLCTSLWGDFARLGSCLAVARRTLLGRWPMTVTDERRVGGLVHFSGRPRWRDGRALLVGEAAGLQDFLWAFGLRTAIRSGVLAARALLDGTDYARDADAAFASRLRGSVVNRFVWEMGRFARYAIPRAAFRWRGADRMMRDAHRESVAQRLLYPMARTYARTVHPHLTF